MVSNASEDLPEPLTPVTTVMRLIGIENEMFLRLLTRAPRTSIASWVMIGACKTRQRGIRGSHKPHILTRKTGKAKEGDEGQCHPGHRKGAHRLAPPQASSRRSVTSVSGRVTATPQGSNVIAAGNARKHGRKLNRGPEGVTSCRRGATLSGSENLTRRSGGVAPAIIL